MHHRLIPCLPDAFPWSTLLTATSYRLQQVLYLTPNFSIPLFCVMTPLTIQFCF
jgi:hypothetical protein